MRYRTTDLLLFVAAIGVFLGWRNFFQQDKSFYWHECNPVMTVTRMVDGHEFAEPQRVRMYYANHQFYTPIRFYWLLARFYVPLALQLILLCASAIAIVVIALRRWPKLAGLLAGSSGLLILLAGVLLLLALLMPEVQHARE